MILLLYQLSYAADKGLRGAGRGREPASACGIPYVNAPGTPSQPSATALRTWESRGRAAPPPRGRAVGATLPP